MFDETSSKWVRWWRNFVKVISILLVAAGVICLLSALGNDFLPEQQTFIILGLVFAVAGCINYFFGMVIANLLYNIQKIRENTDKMIDNSINGVGNINTSNNTVPPVYSDDLPSI